MTHLVATTIWDKINEDPEFKQQPAGAREATRPFIEALPTVLSDLLDKPCTLSNLMKAKVEFLRYCMDKGFIKAVVTALPEDQLGFFSRETMIDTLEEAVNLAIIQAENLTGDDLETLLQQEGVTEDEVMLGSQVDLNDEAKAAYNAHTLTILDLLHIHPMVIVKNQ